MYNTEILFIIFAILFIIGIIIVSYYLYQDSKRPNLPIPPANNNCIKSLDNLINVSNVNNCVLNDGAEGPYKILDGKLIGFHPGAVVANTSTPSLAACSTYCIISSPTNNKCPDGAGQTAYDACIKLTKPVNCNGAAFPVAFSQTNEAGLEYFYIYGQPFTPCQNPFEPLQPT